MLPIFCVSAFSANIPVSFQTHEPDFAVNPDIDIEITKRINTNVVISADVSGKSRTDLSYFRCLVTTSNVKFDDCYALGVGLTLGSGGALYLSVSNLKSDKTTFTNNKANSGGALSVIAGDMILTGCVFKSNTAYENGGAVYVTASNYGIYTEIDDTFDPKQKYQVNPSIYVGDSSNFEDNHARNYGGALYIRSPKYVIVVKSNFTSNTAYMAGSAIFADTAQLNIFDNGFVSNGCNFTTIKNNTANIFKFRYILGQVTGGAIAVYSISGPSAIYTKNNYYNMNYVDGPFIYLMKSAMDIYFGGNQTIKWVASKECYMNYNYYPNLVMSAEFLNCFSENPYLDPKEVQLPVPESKKQNFDSTNYDENTNHANAATRKPYTYYPTEVPVEVKAPGAIWDKNFEQISIPPTRSEPPTPIVVPQRTKAPGIKYSEKITQTETYTRIITETKTIIYTQTTKDKDGTPIIVMTFEESNINYSYYSTTTIDAVIIIEEQDNGTTKNKNLYMFIGIGVGAGILIIALIVIVIVIKIKRSDVASDSSSQEVFMPTETPQITQTMTTTSVTVDNPLFNTTVDEEDPFKADFSSSSSVEELDFMDHHQEKSDVSSKNEASSDDAVNL